MGDIKRIRKKYTSPRHPWEKTRIEEEKKILLEYGLKNKTEIWKTNSVLKKITDQVKKLIALQTVQSEKEKQQLIKKLQKLNLLKEGAELGQALSLTIKDILERRLQTLVYRKKLARTMRQARQFIVHEHIKVGDKLITSPSYLISTEEEDKISFTTSSKLNNPDHPERIEEKPSKEKIEKTIEKKQNE